MSSRTGVRDLANGYHYLIKVAQCKRVPLGSKTFGSIFLLSFRTEVRDLASGYHCLIKIAQKQEGSFRQLDIWCCIIYALQVHQPADQQDKPPLVISNYSFFINYPGKRTVFCSLLPRLSGRKPIAR